MFETNWSYHVCAIVLSTMLVIPRNQTSKSLMFRSVRKILFSLDSATPAQYQQMYVGRRRACSDQGSGRVRSCCTKTVLRMLPQLNSVGVNV